jgi:hypothetical protein
VANKDDDAPAPGKAKELINFLMKNGMFEKRENASAVIKVK